MYHKCTRMVPCPPTQDFAIAFKPVVHDMAVVLVAHFAGRLACPTISALWSADPLIPAPLCAGARYRFCQDAPDNRKYS